MINAFRQTVVLTTIALTLPLGAGAQARDSLARDSLRRAQPLGAVTVTATRSAKSTFATPQPVVVLDSALLHSKLMTATDIFRDLAGLDVSGVASNQRRPEIRGQRGQRILLLQDGLRLNNARRQQDFGELPALAGDASIARVEVVRGPSSVLYGTDAIGGVVNLISAGTPRSYASGEIHGAVEYRYNSAGESSAPNATLAGRFGRLGISANAAFRQSDAYSAPSGSFGDITFADDERVNDTGVRDQSYGLQLGYDVSATQEVFARATWYRAERAGFGYVDPDLLGPGQPLIQIRYPDQDFSRYTLGYRGQASLGIADRFDVTAYTQRNERHLDTHVFVPFGPPGAGVESNSLNFTDLATYGMRAELAKLIGGHYLLTYGADWFRDRSNNADSSTTIVTGFGPPSTRTSNVPTVPNATFRSAGVFAQLEVQPVERLTTVLGARFQHVVAETKPTAGITTATQESTDQSAVWSANALYSVTPNVNAVLAIGRGFRTPNLVERFFEGSAAEGGGFQIANPDLDAETSLNVDVGLRLRRGMWFAETFVFRNMISDAIRIVATGDSVNRLPAFQNRNVGKLRVDGVEVTAGVQAWSGVGASVSYTRLDGHNISSPESPVGDTYSSKLVADATYQPSSELFTLGYTVRYQGKQKDVLVGENPIGSVIPAFTVHSARASLRLPQVSRVRNHLTLSVENISDQLYAEFPNASFFRPEPGRNIRLGILAQF